MNSFLAKKGRAPSNLLISDPRRIKRRKLNDGSAQEDRENEQINSIINDDEPGMNDIGQPVTFNAASRPPQPFQQPMLPKLPKQQIEKPYPGTKVRPRKNALGENGSTASGIDFRLYETKGNGSEAESQNETSHFKQEEDDAEFHDADSNE